MNYCQKGRDMLHALQRSEWLPLYDDEGVRTVIREIDELYSKIVEGVQDTSGIDSMPESLKGSIVYYHQCLQRDRRVLFAYLVHRLEKIRALKWETGPVVPPKIRAILSDRESDYFMEYNKVISSYCNDIGLDLTSDLEPPKELFIEVRAAYDCGELLTYYGLLKFDKGTTHFVRRSDVEHLIRQGNLVQVTAETGV